MPTPESIEQYHIALKAAQKEVRERQAAGLSPYPQVLDELLKKVENPDRHSLFPGMKKK